MFQSPIFGKRVLAALALLALHTPAAAQGPLGRQTVAWTVSAPPTARPGERIVLTLRAAVVDGWHIYGLNQLPTGPTPLRVSVSGDAAAAAGAPTGSKPVKTHDPSFDLQTEFYEHDFSIQAPVRVAARAAAGAQQIPVSVRYQSCNGALCLPPRTETLSATVNLRGSR